MESVSLWSHATAAAAFGMLAIWSARLALNQQQRWLLPLAFGMTALWALLVALFSPQSMPAYYGEASRNISWLAYLYAMWRLAGPRQRVAPIVALYTTLGVVTVVWMLFAAAPPYLASTPRLAEATFHAGLILGMLFSAGALVLVHNLYTAATSDARDVIRLPMIALAIIWVYDLNQYTFSYLASAASTDLMRLRGLAVALTAPLFGLAVIQTGRVTIRLSRTATFQSLSLVAIGAYLTVMVVVMSVIETVAADYARVAQVACVFGTSVVALALLPSPRFRSWLRVKLAKHLFQHRYDYRAEWLRFTETIGRPHDDSAPLDMRIIQAMADITESPGGLLLVPDDSGILVCQARWNWTGADVPSYAANGPTIDYYQSTGRVTELDGLRHGSVDAIEGKAVPDWLLNDTAAWAVVPLVHFGQLSGVVVLQRPLVSRTLDWEDFDLLRVVGRQLASYIAEASGQEALAHAQQFDEFNRRFAFIMHDIKNLVSQLSLVTRNAEKHISNPEFQADMIATLKNSTTRMNEMLARLSQHNKLKSAEPAPMEVGPMLEQIAAAKRIAHPIVIGGDLDQFVVADPGRLTQALTHLVQNAIDASPAGEPVSLSARRLHTNLVIDVIDKGCGMSAHFIHHSLFKPFASTKDGGFGIGAYESRALVAAMGGRLDVTSREGEGSVFRITLPLAGGPRFHFSQNEAKVA